jgi:hypothetical protein
LHMLITISSKLCVSPGTTVATKRAVLAGCLVDECCLPLRGSSYLQ